jgi:branched-chain amino acid transport system ATP-binding protein
MSGTVLDVSDLHAGYRGVEAVRGISLRVNAGEIATVIGANGAGKTTLLNAIMGVLPARGSVTFFGQPLNRLPAEERVSLGLSLVPERRELFGAMSVEDNLRLGGFRFWGRPWAEAAIALEEVFAIFPRLKERRRQLAGTLSGGERQMLAMGRALMSKPRLLMLDEPSLGLAPLIVRDIFRVIAGLKGRGAAILLVEQNARAALEIAGHGYVIENGLCAIAASSAELRADSRVIESYLGFSRTDRGAGF